mmetsp:Transcript_53107/g.63985  ORF Transcript_53107/g.63985 Transcript_53107/m.63985 type:complete len:198 (+) Transcript_53107:132-725(+)|eukprot:CAMPEP_0194402370 /NCGR_PEP_ID=MMETSP0176-20130528/1062_1 /TAXON_ID=216777 /ORGANISM="Proboscia alata, Strain PI-D3" /LENGTH=197 /DNA_ID=CAMNT_0039199669 /DNA_START=39 /DNA_END=632 /DNA_ORIENTATION=-
MVKFNVFIGALLASSASAFVSTAPARTSFVSLSMAESSPKPTTDFVGNNLLIKEILETVQEKGILSKVASSGLLSKAKEAGVSLKNVEELLVIAAQYPDVLILVEASTPEILPILPKVLGLAPPLIPLLASLIQVPAALLQGGALASVAAAGALVVLVPDDTIVDVAIQTFGVAVLGLAIPAVSLGGSLVLGQLTKK